MASRLNPEAAQFEMNIPTSPVPSASDASNTSDCNMSTFFESVDSQSSLDEDPTEFRPKPLVKLPPAPGTLPDIYVEQKRAYYQNYESPTWEEEAALFDTTGVPVVRFPPMSSNFFNSNGEVPENMEVNPNTSTYEDLMALFATEHGPIVKFPPVPSSAVTIKNGLAPVHGGIQTLPTHEEESAMFDTALAPRVSSPPFTAVFNVEYTAARAREVMLIPSAPRSFDDVTVVDSDDLFDNVIRVRLPPAPEQVFEETLMSGLGHTEDDLATSSEADEQTPSASSDSNMITGAADFLAHQSNLEDSIHLKLAFKFYAEAEKFVPEKKYPWSTLNAEAPDFIPLTHLNPQAVNFVPEKEVRYSKLNPAAAIFVPHVLLDSEEWGVILRETQQSPVPEQKSREPSPLMQDTPEFSDVERNSNIHQEDDDFVPMLTAAYQVYDCGDGCGYHDEMGDFTLLSQTTNENHGLEQDSEFVDGPDEAMQPMQHNYKVCNHQQSPGYYNKAGFFMPFAHVMYGVPNYEQPSYKQNSDFNEEDNQFIPMMSAIYATHEDYPRSNYHDETGDFFPLNQAVHRVHDNRQTFNGYEEEAEYVPPTQASFDADEYAFSAEFDPDEPKFLDPVTQVKQTYWERMAESAIVAENAIARATVTYEETTPEQQEYQRQHRLPDFVKPPAPGRYAANHRVECHHFSFFGQPEQHKNATSPARSFAIICGAPKLKLACDLDAPDLRREVCLHNATHLVDPVVFYGDLDALDGLSGYQLEKAVEGSVHKTYSGNGLWRESVYPPKLTPQFDPMDRDQDEDDETYFNATNRLHYLTQPRALEIADDNVNEAKRKALRRETFVLVASRMNDASSFADREADKFENENGSDGSESVSDAESIHPEFVPSPLKPATLLPRPKDLDESLMISPLEFLKVSSQYVSDSNASQSSDQDSGSGSTEVSYWEGGVDDSGLSTPATSDGDDSGSDVSFSIADISSDEGSDEQGNRIQIPPVLALARQIPSTRNLVVYQKKSLWPIPTVSEYPGTPIVNPCRKLEPTAPYPSGILCRTASSLQLVRSEARRNLDRDLDSAELHNSNKPPPSFGETQYQNYCKDLIRRPEALEQLSTGMSEFFTQSPMTIEELGKLRLKKNRTSPQYTGSPIKRSQAPTPNAMRYRPGGRVLTTIDEEQSVSSSPRPVRGTMSKGGNEVPIIHMPLALRPKSVSQIPTAPIRFPSNLKDLDFADAQYRLIPSGLPRQLTVRIPPGQWLAQKMEGNTTQHIHLWKAPLDPSIEKLQAHVSTTTDEGTDPSTINPAVPYHPSAATLAGARTATLTFSATLCLPGPSQLGAQVQSYFDHTDPVEPSPSKSVVQNTFEDFSGVHPAAADGEYPSGTSPSRMKVTVTASPVRKRGNATKRTFAAANAEELVTEDILPPAGDAGGLAHVRKEIKITRSVTPPSSIRSVSESPSPVLARATAFQDTQQRSVRDVLFSRTTRTRRVDESLGPSLRASSWGVVNNKLCKAQKNAARDNESVGDRADGKKDGNKDKGKFGKWFDRVFGSGFGKVKGKYGMMK